MGCVTSVAEDELAVVQRFGQFHRIAEPGLLFNIPMFNERAGTLSKRVQFSEDTTLTKTADHVSLELKVTVMYEIIPEKAYHAFYELSHDPTAQIMSNVADVVRGQVPTKTLDELFEAKEMLALTIKGSLKEFMSKYGFQVRAVLVTDIMPENKNKKAMNEIQVNKRLVQARQNEAESAKIQQVKRAEADAESKYLMGVGLADQRKAIVTGLRSSVSEFSQQVAGMNAKDVLELVLITQYFDTLKDLSAGSEGGTLMFPHNPASLRDLSSDIRRSFSS